MCDCDNDFGRILTDEEVKASGNPHLVGLWNEEKKKSLKKGFEFLKIIQGLKGDGKNRGDRIKIGMRNYVGT